MEHQGKDQGLFPRFFAFYRMVEASLSCRLDRRVRRIKVFGCIAMIDWALAGCSAFFTYWYFRAKQEGCFFYLQLWAAHWVAWCATYA